MSPVSSLLRPRIWSVLVVPILLAALARAHDPISSWAVVQPQANGLHFTLSIADSEANVFVRNIEPSANIATDAPFEKLQPLLLKHAGDFFELRAGGKRLAQLEAQVVFTDEQMIEVRLVFAWPEGGGDSLQCRAALLDYVSPDHTTFLNVLDRDERLIAGVMPTRDEPIAVTPMPPRPTAPAKDSTAAKTGPQS